MTPIFQFCPFCGAEYSEENRQEFSAHCSSCQKTYFQNQSSAVCGIIIFEDKLLLTKRGRDPYKGLWDVPGGFVEPLEHPEETMVREIKEELNLDVKVVKLLKILAPIPYLYNGFQGYNCDHHYVLKVDSLAGIKPQDDVVDFKLFTREDAPELDQCAFESTKFAVTQFKAGKI